MEKLNKLNHVAIILDGNRRWAKEKGKTSLEGHKAGLENLIKLSEHILKTETTVLSVYAFSTENFKRSSDEVNYLMKLFTNSFVFYKDRLAKANIKVVFSGNVSELKQDLQESIYGLIDATKDNDGGILNICLNYGGHAEIINAVKKINREVVDGKLDINTLDETKFNKYLWNDLPPIDLLIRPGGEKRLSNFMLWQVAYAEFYYPDVYFPDFNCEEYDKAVLEYNNRERRFGGNK